MKVWEIAEEAARAAADKKGYDIIILNISPISLIADYFVITSAKNRAQMEAIADHVIERLNTCHQSLLHREGRGTSPWLLLDYGAVVVHIFKEKARQFYALESLWGDAPVHRLENRQ
ncbi:MAG TPA: ribosome silencing factor [bacterium]|nr:ribosome silencing factor [bacterium]